MTTEPIYLLATASLPERIKAEAAAANLVLTEKAFIAMDPLPQNGWQVPADAPVVVFTSRNAVGVVAARGARHSGWRIYCLSGATAEKAGEAFGADRIAGTADSGGALALVIAAAESPGKVWFFCGEQRREELPAELTKAGFEIVEQVVYRTVLKPHKLDRNYQGIAFFSPSGVESYFAANEPGSAVLFAIGETTASAIRARCPNPLIVAERPDKSLLIRRMIEYFQAEPI